MILPTWNCGCCRNPHECAEAKFEFNRWKLRRNVATRTNALRQRPTTMLRRINGYSRNPHECAEAKDEGDEGEKLAEVATRTNALRQRFTA